MVSGSVSVSIGICFSLLLILALVLETFGFGLVGYALSGKGGSLVMVVEARESMQLSWFWSWWIGLDPFLVLVPVYLSLWWALDQEQWWHNNQAWWCLRNSQRAPHASMGLNSLGTQLGTMNLPSNGKWSGNKLRLTSVEIQSTDWVQVNFNSGRTNDRLRVTSKQTNIQRKERLSVKEQTNDVRE